MIDEKYVAEPFGLAGNLGRRLREIFGEVHGGIDDRMMELLRELDFVPSAWCNPGKAGSKSG